MENKYKLVFVFTFMVVLLLIIVPTRLILIDSSKSIVSNTHKLLFKTKYLDIDDTTIKMNINVGNSIHYKGTQYHVQSTVGPRGCYHCYSKNGKFLIIKGWYSWKDTISYCGFY